MPISPKIAGMVPDPSRPSAGIPLPPPPPPSSPAPDIFSAPTQRTTSYRPALIAVQPSRIAVAPVAQALDTLITGTPV